MKTLNDLSFPVHLRTRVRNILGLYVGISLGHMCWETMPLAEFAMRFDSLTFLKIKGAGAVALHAIQEAMDEARPFDVGGSGSGPPPPIPNPPDPEKAIRDTIVVDTAAMLRRFSALVAEPGTNAVRILRVASDYTKAIQRVLAEIALEKDERRDLGDDGDDDVGDVGYETTRGRGVRARRRNAYLNPDTDPASVAANMSEALRGQEISGLGTLVAKARRDGDTASETWASERLRALGAPFPSAKPVGATPQDSGPAMKVPQT